MVSLHHSVNLCGTCFDVKAKMNDDCDERDAI